MKCTLINGASGLIGSRLIERFNKNEIKINLKKKINKKFFRNYKTVYLDFSKKNLDFSFLKDVKTLIHSASLDKISSDKYPQKAKTVNYDFIKKLIYACKKYNVKKLIKISTSKVYGDFLNKKITENSSLNPFDRYSLYHAKSDLLLQNYSKNSYMDIIILRVSNGYGYPAFHNPKCWKLIVNNFCYQIYHKKIIKINSKINYTKNFIDMNYLINIFKFFNDYPKKINGIFNVGSKDNITIYDMALKIKQVAKKNKLDNIKILTQFKNNETNFKYSYSTKKLIDLKPMIIENREIEIYNLFEYLKKNNQIS